MTTVNIGYTKGDYHYSKMDRSNILLTIPENTLTDDDGRITETKCDRILNPTNKQAFIDDISQNLQLYLQGIDLDQLASNFTDNVLFGATAKITIDDGNNKYNYDGKSSSLKVSQNAIGQLGQNFNMNFVMPQPAKATINKSNGTVGGAPVGDPTSTPSATVANTTYTQFFVGESQPKCFITNGCTKLHYHYQGYTYNPNGPNGCECTPVGNQVYDDSPHTHCEEVDTSGTGKGGSGGNVNKDLLNAAGSYKQITMNLKTTPKYGGNALGSIDVGIGTTDIVEQIYHYYQVICVNQQKANLLKKSQEQTDATEQLYHDANTTYFKEYSGVLNMSLGIVFSLWYIYYLSKNK